MEIAPYVKSEADTNLIQTALNVFFERTIVFIEING
jgi:hypothetical protein